MFECRHVEADDLQHLFQVYVNERVVNTTSDGLFAILDDEGSWPVWVPGIERVDWTTERPFGVGTTRTVFFTGGMQIFETFTAWNHAERMAFCLTGASQRVWWAFGEDWQVSDLGDGRCHVRWLVGYEPRFVFRAIHFLVRPLMSLALSKMLDNLSSYVDEHGSSGAG
jgi:ribosome-associated toxin RatA of RatAB toxin-antitoxin module